MIQTLAPLLVFIAITITGLALQGFMEHPGPAPESASLQARVENFVRLRRVQRSRRMFRQAWVLFMLGFFLLFVNLVTSPSELSARRPNTEPAASAASGGQAPTGGSPEEPVGSTTVPSLERLNWFLGISGLLILVGAALLLLGKGRITKGAGIAALIAGLGHEFFLVKNLNVDKLVGVEIPLDVQATVEAELRKISGFGPQRIASIEGFELGRAEILPSMNAAITGVCRAWTDASDDHAVLLVIGGSDRIRLKAAAQRRFESNVGLAQARALRVSERLLACGVPEPNVLTLASGPRFTPAFADEASASKGFPSDRRVEVWMFRQSVDLHHETELGAELSVGAASDSKQ